MDTQTTTNPVILLIEAGHIASFGGKDMNDPQTCKKCVVSWPCPPILQARKTHTNTINSAS
jgi:hypothetical protein